MAHFAKVNKETGVVETVIVATQAHIYSLPDSEDWVQTSYNRNFRKNYAGVGYTYDKQRDAFIPPKPYESWVLNEETCQWEPPVPFPSEIPSDGMYYKWNEQLGEWKEYALSE